MMLARAAAGFYWMGRYLERTEQTARLLQYQLTRLVDTPAEEVALGWRVIYRALEQDPPPAPADADEAEVFLMVDAYTLAARLVEDASHPDSVISCWTIARENAKQLRPWLPVRVWTCLNQGFFHVRDSEFSHAWERNPASLAGEIIDGLRLLAGVVDGTMSRDDAWRFMELGRFVERLQQQVNLLSTWNRLGQPADGNPALSWASLLRVSGAYEFYCRAHSMTIRRNAALRFLMRHPELPRSVRFTVGRIQELLSGIDPGGARYPLAPPHRMTLRLAAGLETEIKSKGPVDDDGDSFEALRSDGRALHALLMATYVDYPVEEGTAAVSVRYSVRHELEFRYDAPVQGSMMTVFLQPIRDRCQLLQSFSIRTDPGGPVFPFEGPFGNRGHFFNRPHTHDRLVIRARSTVETTPPDALPSAIADPSGDSALTSPELRLMLQPSRFVRPQSPDLARFLSAQGVEEREGELLETVRRLRSALYRAFQYSPGSTTADSPMEHILESGQGVCQDYAHVMISVLRRWGMPARYVSGYLGPDLDHERPGPDDQAPMNSESHAWVECWLPGSGWRGFDPANDCDCDERHVRVAVGRDYADVPPVRGVFSGSATSVLTTAVRVSRE